MKKSMLSKLASNKEEKSYEEAAFEEAQSNLNNMSYWLPKVLNCGIEIPKTKIISLTLNQFAWFVSDSYSEAAIAEMGSYLTEYIENDFDLTKPLFLKTGRFSNKFDFNSCKLTDIEKIGEQFLEIYYASMLVGAGNNSELVVREFISSQDDIPTIYNGMPLNTEFRAFYNFDKNEVLGIFNYWDTDVMIKGLTDNVAYAYSESDAEERMKELNVFKDYSKVLESNFENNKDDVKTLIEESMLKVEGLDGVWSIDLMLVDGVYYLIDMAIGEQSYYYNRLNLE